MNLDLNKTDFIIDVSEDASKYEDNNTKKKTNKNFNHLKIINLDDESENENSLQSYSEDKKCLREKKIQSGGIKKKEISKKNNSFIKSNNSTFNINKRKVNNSFLGLKKRRNFEDNIKCEVLNNRKVVLKNIEYIYDDELIPKAKNLDTCQPMSLDKTSRIIKDSKSTQTDTLPIFDSEKYEKKIQELETKFNFISQVENEKYSSKNNNLILKLFGTAMKLIIRIDESINEKLDNKCQNCEQREKENYLTSIIPPKSNLLNSESKNDLEKGSSLYNFKCNTPIDYNNESLNNKSYAFTIPSKYHFNLAKANHFQNFPVNKLNKSIDNKNQDNNFIKCYKCGRNGHKMRNCTLSIIK